MSEILKMARDMAKDLRSVGAMGSAGSHVTGTKARFVTSRSISSAHSRSTRLRGSNSSDLL